MVGVGIVLGAKGVVVGLVVEVVDVVLVGVVVGLLEGVVVVSAIVIRYE